MKGALNYELLKTYEGKCFRTINSAFAVGAASVYPVHLKNPVSSGKTLVLVQSFWTAGGLAAGTVGDLVIEFFKGPTTSADGTGLTISNSQIGSAVATVATAFHTPTVSADGVLMSTVKCQATSNSLSIIHDGKLQLAQNNVLLVKVTGTVALTTVTATLIWLEL